METRVSRLQLATPFVTGDRLHKTIADRTKKIYDRVSFIYPASTFFFHSRAHAQALDASGIRDGMKVLEVATGSGEMFRRLVKVNPSGRTIGLDLSPNMAARTQRHARREFKGANVDCQAVDARHLPFKDESFDAVMCCYLLELLGSSDIALALGEIRRVIKTGSLFTLVVIGENTAFFNKMYKVGGSIAPAFWGRQVESKVPEMLESFDFRIERDCPVRQGFYPSRVLTARAR